MNKLGKILVMMVATVLIITVSVILLSATSKNHTPKITKITATQTTATVEWSKISDAKQYKLYKKRTSASKWTLVKTTRLHSFKVKNLESCTSYSFKVRVYYGKNSYKQSAVKTVRTKASSTAGKTTTINVNGVSICYETMGKSSGKPVILVHGNGGSHSDLALISNKLAASGYRVYALDSRGQGANAPLSEYHYADMAEDVYKFIKALGLKKPAYYGWSDGGIIGLMLEINHPGTLKAMAISGANITPEGAGFSEEMVSPGMSPLETMMMTEPHITPAQLKSITIPVLVTAGEDDLILPEHTQLIANSLPNSKLVIMKGENHGSYITGNDKMGTQLVKFLGEKY